MSEVTIEVDSGQLRKPIKIYDYFKKDSDIIIVSLARDDLHCQPVVDFKILGYKERSPKIPVSEFLDRVRVNIPLYQYSYSRFKVEEYKKEGCVIEHDFIYKSSAVNGAITFTPTYDDFGRLDFVKSLEITDPDGINSIQIRLIKKDFKNNIDQFLSLKIDERTLEDNQDKKSNGFIFSEKQLKNKSLKSLDRIKSENNIYVAIRVQDKKKNIMTTWFNTSLSY